MGQEACSLSYRRPFLRPPSGLLFVTFPPWDWLFFRIHSLWVLFLPLLVFPAALSTVVAAPSSPSLPDFFRVVFFLVWGHRGRLSVLVLFSSSPHSCSHRSSSHVPRLALVFPFWPWVLWGCICILHCAERTHIVDPHLKQRPVLSMIN